MKNLTKIICSIAVLAMLSGCNPETVEKTGDYSLPSGLSDCKVWRLTSSGGGNLTAIRCPNSSTTTIQPKHIPVTVVVEEPKPEPEYEIVINGEKYKTVKQTK